MYLDVLLEAGNGNSASNQHNRQRASSVFGAEFVARYGGDREALLASARYPKIEFTFTEAEQKLAVAEMEMLVEVGEIPRLAPLASLFIL